MKWCKENHLHCSCKGITFGSTFQKEAKCPLCVALDSCLDLIPYVLYSRPGAKSINSSEDTVSLLVTALFHKVLPKIKKPLIPCPYHDFRLKIWSIGWQQVYWDHQLLVDALAYTAFCHHVKFLGVCRIWAQNKNEIILNRIYLNEILQSLLCLDRFCLSPNIYFKQTWVRNICWNVIIIVKIHYFTICRLYLGNLLFF